MVIVDVALSGTSYVQQGALLPHGKLQALPKVRLVQKHGMLAGMGLPSLS